MVAIRPVETDNLSARTGLGDGTGQSPIIESVLWIPINPGTRERAQDPLTELRDPVADGRGAVLLIVPNQLV
ncbi:MAG TPA: hypothetical protein VFT29_18955 [Gemmatimonadaceae bacterium]|nr:hypothetical protein [Gemmatimonadaceae bacterium]